MSRPARVIYVETERRVDVWRGWLPQPARDRFQRVGISFGRLPADMWHCLGKVKDMLPRTAADLQHLALRRQYAHENLGNRPLIPFGRWTDNAAIGQDFRGFATHFASSPRHGGQA